MEPHSCWTGLNSSSHVGSSGGAAATQAGLDLATPGTKTKVLVHEAPTPDSKTSKYMRCAAYYD